MGTKNPLGLSVEEFWNNIKANKLGFSFVNQFDATDFPIKVVGAVKNFDPLDYFEKKEARKLCRFTQFAVSSTKDALNDAKTDFKDLDPFRVGVIIGAGISAEEPKSNPISKLNGTNLPYFK